MRILKSTAALAALAILIPSGAQAAESVALADAASAPSHLRLLEPGESVTRSRQCGRDDWSNVNAYRWNGRALAAQRWTQNGWRWGRVTFEAGRFTNGSRSAVLVAGWCDR